MAILGELFFPFPWHRQIWKRPELSRSPMDSSQSATENSIRYGREEKRKEKRENKRRIRGKKEEDVNAEKERDGRALWRWRRATTTVRIFHAPPFHNSTLGFGMLAYKFASAALFFFSPPTPLFLSVQSFFFFPPLSHRFANFYNLPAADTARAITFERISRNVNTRAQRVFLYVQIKGRFFFAAFSSFTFLSPFANPPLKIPYFLTRPRIKET